MNELKPLLGLTAGPTVRRRGGRADSFIRNNLSKLSEYTIFCTKGTHKDLLSEHGQLASRCLRPGPEGGFVDLTRRVSKLPRGRAARH